MIQSMKMIYKILEDTNSKVNKFSKIDLIRTSLKEPIIGDVLRKVLEYLSGESWHFGIKKINYCVYFEDEMAVENQNTDSIFKMLEYISKLDNISEDAICFLEKISSSDPETVEVVTRILSKESGTGLTNDEIQEILAEV